MKLPSWGNSIWKWVVCNRLIVSLLAVLGALSGMVWWCGWDWLTTVWWCSWRWLRTGSSNLESGSTTIRNVGLVIGGGIAIGLAYWRSIVADRQARASQQQAETSQRGLLNERYQKGVDMLGSEDLSVRLGGIYELLDLAEDEPEQYHVKVKRKLCAFVRHPAKGEDDEARPPVIGQSIIKTVRADVQDALSAIGSPSSYVGMVSEKKAGFRINLAAADLTGANLLGAFLSNSDLNRANLTGADLVVADLAKAFLLRANLTGADLTSANLSHAHLNAADLVNANLSEADLTGTDLSYANLTGAVFSKASGLTQEELDQARADPANPPKLDSTYDAKTGKLLEWCGPPRRK